MEKKISAAKAEPVHANPASRPFLLAVRSATAPRNGSSTAEKIVVIVMSQKNSEPGATLRPSTSTRSSGPAAFSASPMKYGPNMTVPMVVT